MFVNADSSQCRSQGCEAVLGAKDWMWSCVTALGGYHIIGISAQNPSVGRGWVLETLLFLPESHLRMGRRGVFLERQYFKSKDRFNKGNTDCNSLKKICIYFYVAADCLVSYWLLWVQLYLRGCAGVPIWCGPASCSISTWWMGVCQREVSALFTLLVGLENGLLENEGPLELPQWPDCLPKASSSSLDTHEYCSSWILALPVVARGSAFSSLTGELFWKSQFWS